MKTNFTTDALEARALTRSRITTNRTWLRLPRRSKLAAAMHAGIAAPLFLIAAISSGCATTNYDFDAISELHGKLREERLAGDLEREQVQGKGNELYDLDAFPLAYTHLNVFSKSNDDDVPAGFVEANVEAYLPLFGFVDATINRYDTDCRMYERHDYDSYLWGLFQVHREQIETNVGLRKKKKLRFLWVLEWWSTPKYSDSRLAPTEE